MADITLSELENIVSNALAERFVQSGRIQLIQSQTRVKTGALRDSTRVVVIDSAFHIVQGGVFDLRVPGGYVDYAVDLQLKYGEIGLYLSTEARQFAAQLNFEA